MALDLSDAESVVLSLFPDDEQTVDDLVILEKYISGILKGEFFIRLDKETAFPIWDIGNWTQDSLEKWEKLCQETPLYAYELSIVCHFAWFHYLMKNVNEPYDAYHFTANENACLRSVRWSQDF